jgi:hypothetical protein
LVCTKWKQHTSFQTKWRTLLTKRNDATTQIVSSHIGSCEEMKEGNWFIHIGIIIWNVPGFEYWTHIDFLCFGITCFFLVPLSCAKLDFTIVWVFLNCWFVSIIAILTRKIRQIICLH